MRDTSRDWVTLLTKTVDTAFGLKAGELPIIKFLAFNKDANLGEDALKTVYRVSYGFESEIINFIFQVTPQNT